MAYILIVENDNAINDLIAMYLTLTVLILALDISLFSIIKINRDLNFQRENERSINELMLITNNIYENIKIIIGV